MCIITIRNTGIFCYSLSAVVLLMKYLLITMGFLPMGFCPTGLLTVSQSVHTIITHITLAHT